jgi:predicted kinase
VSRSSFFDGISPNIKYCINDEETDFILFNNKKKSNCSDICFKKNIIFDPINNKCIDSCSKEENKYKYNDICYNVCPENTFIIANNTDKNNLNKKKCYDKTPEGYYLDLKNQSFKKCFDNCKNCYGEGNDTNNNCKECISSYILLNESKYNNNCYKKCDYFYYFDESNKFYCNETCPEQYNKIIIKKNKCIDKCKNDDIYLYEYNNTCYDKCPNNTYILKDNEDYFSHEREVFDKFINEIKDGLTYCNTTIADATHLNEASRNKLLRRLGSSLKNIKVIAIVINPSLKTILTQNAQREGRKFVPEDQVKKMYYSFKKPSLDEGFDEIWIYKGNHQYEIIQKFDNFIYDGMKFAIDFKKEVD